jgi:two-component sensor histidine kinase
MFFAVCLYYSERLAFFDAFLKGGTYFAAGLVVLTVVAAAGAAGSARFGTWDRVWFAALLWMPAWLLAPAVNRWLGDWIDRRVLKRRYSPAAAEAMFSQALQSAGTEDQLLEHATEALQDIFGCPVDIARDGEPVRSHPGDLVAGIVPSGTVRLHASRRPGPFLSEEQRLLQALTVILGGSLHSLQLRRLREEQRVREEELQALTTRAELRALRAQINPHFLFNALNAVAGCIRTRPEVADDTLTQLAEVFRYTLTRSDKEWVRLGEELDFLRSYLAVEQTRFGDRLQVTVDADRSAASVMVPAMILQPIVENAIKHGTSGLTSIGEVGIDVCLSAGDLLRIVVSDNGPGFPSVLSMDRLDRGHGLRNVAERLNRYYGDAGKLQWQNGPGRTIVTIQIPVRTVRQCAC